MKILPLLLLPLTLTACPLLTLIPVLPPGQLGETPTLTGTAANWSGLSKTIKLEVQKPVSGTLEYLGAGTIDAAGKFLIVLPGTSVMNPYLETSKDVYKPTNCSTINVNPADVRGSSIVNLAVFDGTTKIGLISLQPDQLTTVGDHFAALLFFDKAADFNVACRAGVAYNHLHTSVGLGWNYDINELYAPNLSHEYVGGLPSTIKWTYAGSSLTNPGHLGETPLLEGNVRGWVGYLHF
jgi:hypothetical protein